MLLPIVILIFAVIAVMFAVCLIVFIKSYRSYSDEDEELYNDAMPKENARKIQPSEVADKVRPAKAPKEEPAVTKREKARPADAKNDAADEAAAGEAAAEEARGFDDTRVAASGEMQKLRTAAAAPAEAPREPAEKKGSKLVPIVTAVAASVAVICVIALAAVLIQSRRPAVEETPETMAVTSEDISLHQNVSGLITSPDTLTSIFAATGDVDEVKVEEGDFVKKGDAIYVLDSGNLQARIDLLEERLSAIDVGDDENVSVNAPVGGVITRLRVSSGSVVSGGSVIAEITPPAVRSLSVVLDSQVSQGDKLNVSYGGETIQGTVTSVREISPAPEDGDGGEDEPSTDDEDGDEAEPRSWSVAVAFSSTADEGSYASVTVNGRRFAGQVTGDSPEVERVTAEATGTIVNLKVKAGDTVSEGALIAEIETPASAQAAENKFDAKELQIDIDQCRSELENYTLRASADGYVQKLFLKKGEKAAINMNAVTIVPQDSLALKIELDAETAENMTLPAAVSFKVNRTGGFPGEVWDRLDADRVFHVTLDALSPSDGEGGVYVGYIALDDEKQEIFRSGMTAKVSVTTYTAYNVPVIPAELVKDGKVKILTADGRTESVEVQTGVVTGEGGIEIKSGLNRTDRLVID